MPQPSRLASRSPYDRLRATIGQRAAGIAFALLAETLLVLLLLTLGAPSSRPKAGRTTVFSMSPARDELAVPKEESAPPSPARSKRDMASAERPALEPPESEPPRRAPVEQPSRPFPPLIQLSREQMAAVDSALLPARPAAAAPRPPAAGPPDKRGPSGDTPRVEGVGPNGEPLYAAAWYREPYPEELRGYLSTSRGPGWGLIACRTVRDYRVEDCVAVGEYPERSNIARSVLAAAWQFRVRPPRLGGESKMGEWVRIRIDYDLQRR